MRDGLVLVTYDVRSAYGVCVIPTTSSLVVECSYCACVGCYDDVIA